MHFKSAKCTLKVQSALKSALFVLLISWKFYEFLWNILQKLWNLWHDFIKNLGIVQVEQQEPSTKGHTATFSDSNSKSLSKTGRDCWASCMNSVVQQHWTLAWTLSRSPYDTVQITQELGSFTTTWLELLGSSVWSWMKFGQSHCDFKQSELFMFMETWYSWTSAPNCICEILRFILSLRAAIFLGVFSIIDWWISTNSLIWPCHHLVRVPFSITPPICPRDFLQKDAPGFCANTLQPG